MNSLTNSPWILPTGSDLLPSDGSRGSVLVRKWLYGPDGRLRPQNAFIGSSPVGFWIHALRFYLIDERVPANKSCSA